MIEQREVKLGLIVLGLDRSTPLHTRCVMVRVATLESWWYTDTVLSMGSQGMCNVSVSSTRRIYLRGIVADLSSTFATDPVCLESCVWIGL